MNTFIYFCLLKISFEFFKIISNQVTKFLKNKEKNVTVYTLVSEIKT